MLGPKMGSEGRSRSAQWFCLGISLAPLLKVDNAVDMIKSTTLAMDEFEHNVSDFATQKMVRHGRVSLSNLGKPGPGECWRGPTLCPGFLCWTGPR